MKREREKRRTREADMKEIRRRKIILYEFVEACRVVRSQGSYIFSTAGSQMAVRVSGFAARKIPGTHFC
jgi:hypothetical protein